MMELDTGTRVRALTPMKYVLDPAERVHPARIGTVGTVTLGPSIQQVILWDTGGWSHFGDVQFEVVEGE